MRPLQSHIIPRRIFRISLAVVSLLVCFYLIKSTASAGLSRLYSVSVVKGTKLPGTDAERLVAVAEESSRLSPSDPEAFRARGAAHMAQQRSSDAVKEFSQAVALRPRHYLLWMDLGRACDQSDDVEGAIKAFQQAVRLAPYFAQPRWQLANVLFRAERYDEAFVELRRAIAGDPTLLPLSMEMAWAGSRGDAEKFTKMIDPSDASQRLTVGRFLAKHGNAQKAVGMFHATGGIADEDRKALVRELIVAKKYASAYDVWASGRTGPDEVKHGIATITDGSFEGRIILNDPGFGWQVNAGVATCRVTLETTITREGSRSLRVEWNGDSNPFSQLVTQLVLVEPNKTYRLNFSALGRGLISGGMPMVVVSDANASEYKTLGNPAVVTDSERDWNEYEVEFKTSDKTEAVLISLQRRPCASGPCPIFGRVWLDSFTLTPM